MNHSSRRYLIAPRPNREGHKAPWVFESTLREVRTCFHVFTFHVLRSEGRPDTHELTVTPHDDISCPPWDGFNAVLHNTFDGRFWNVEVQEPGTGEGAP